MLGASQLTIVVLLQFSGLEDLSPAPPLPSRLSYECNPENLWCFCARRAQFVFLWCARKDLALTAKRFGGHGKNDPRERNVALRDER